MREPSLRGRAADTLVSTPYKLLLRLPGGHSQAPTLSAKLPALPFQKLISLLFIYQTLSLHPSYLSAFVL